MYPHGRKSNIELRYTNYIPQDIVLFPEEFSGQQQPPLYFANSRPPSSLRPLHEGQCDARNFWGNDKMTVTNLQFLV